MASQRIFMGQITTGSMGLVGTFNELVSPLSTSAQGLWGCAVLIQGLTPGLKEPVEKKANGPIKNMDCKLLTRILGNY